MKAIKRYLEKVDSVNFLAIFAICLYTTILISMIFQWI